MDRMSILAEQYSVRGKLMRTGAGMAFAIVHPAQPRHYFFAIASFSAFPGLKNMAFFFGIVIALRVLGLTPLRA